mmetsp:Transcript_95476/g.269845  ORF Transcript_95476/g.269845 Transcript_95476/m.269845 type:complete len:555 (-) Transcript_95476:72-1736(-)
MGVKDWRWRLPGAEPMPPVETTPLKRPGAEQKRSTLLQDPAGWGRRLSERLSWPFLGSIFITHHLLKGVLAGGGDDGLLGKPVEFLLGAQHVPAARMQALSSVGATAPWVLKPLVGFLSDTVPIFGYSRRPYLAVVTVFAIVAVANLGCGLTTSPTGIVLSLFFASLQVATATLLVDAKQSELVKQQADLGPDLVTFRETCMNSGQIISAIIAGPLVTYGGPRMPYFVALPIVATLLAVPMGNWLGEQRLPPGQDRMNVRMIQKNPYLFGLGMLLVPLLSCMACGSALRLPEHALAAMAAVAALTVVFGYALLIRPEISGPIVFYFLVRCSNLQLNGAMFYFFTDSFSSFPEGPHFSPFFYVTCMTTVAITGRLVGFMTAKDVVGHLHYRKALVMMVPLVACTQLLLVPLLLRWNLALGISDEIWVLGWTFLDMVARGWRQFPFSVLLLQTTPRGLEASSLALNTGAVNMGMTLSFFFGSFALQCFQVMPRGHAMESAALVNLWKAQVAAAVMPILVLPLMPLLLPHRTQSEPLIVDNPTSATHGGLAERCCGV